MSIRLDGTTIRLAGACHLEEAETLASLLATAPDATVDLAACTQLHGAVLQALLALRPPLAGAPADPFLATWVFPPPAS